MQGLSYRWRVASLPGASSLGIAERLLLARAGSEERRRRIFERPEIRDLHPHASLPGATAAAAALVASLRAERTLAIYGDYDVDGIAATAILWHAIRLLAPQVRVRMVIPDRIEDGYGLSQAAVETLAAEGVQTIVTVDCGITAIEAARRARELGVQLIVTDHHERRTGPDGSHLIPDAEVVVHPEAQEPTAPWTGLCGAAVAWKLAICLAAEWYGSERIPEVARTLLGRLLSLAALGTVADVVPLLDENRIIVAAGLRRLAGSGIPGVEALLACRALTGDVSTEEVGFRLAPTLNACGRLGHAAEALELLTTADAARAKAIVGRLAKMNEERKTLERGCAEQAIARARAEGFASPERRAVLLADAGWHEGVLGVACNRVVDALARPAILLQQRGDRCKGSGRSVEGVHLLECLRECDVPFLRCGGHAMAAGLEVAAADLPRLVESFVAAVNRRLPPESLVPELAVDGRVALEELSHGAVSGLSRLEPFGKGNPRPRLLVEGALAGIATELGRDGRHAQLELQLPAAGHRTLRAVWWDGLGKARALPRGERLDLVVEPRIDTFRRRNEVMLTVVDVRVAGRAAAPAAASSGAGVEAGAVGGAGLFRTPDPHRG